MNAKVISDYVDVRKPIAKNSFNDKHILNKLANFTTSSFRLNHRLN